MRRTLLLLAISSCSLLTACDNGIHFAESTDAERARAVHAAMGNDGMRAAALAKRFIDGRFDASTCPARQTDGDVVTITGGCVHDSGWHLDGAAVITKHGKEAMSIHFADLRGSDDQGSSFGYDGTVEYAETAGGAIRIVSHLSSDVPGSGRVISDLEVTCDETSECHTADGGTIELPGLGTAEVVAAWSRNPGDGPAYRGSMELLGADILHVDLAVVDEDDCAPGTGKPTGGVCVTVRR